MKNKYLMVVALILVVVVIIGINFLLNLNKNQISSYSNVDFMINYPSNSEIWPEIYSFPNKVVISSPDFDMNTTNGNITSGFSITILPSVGYDFDHIDICNKDYESWKNTTEPCLLANEDSSVREYTNGEVIKNKEVINNYSAIKYEFISSTERNNNIGLVVNKNGTYYTVIIAYKDDKNIELFDTILNSFKFNK